MRKHLFGTAVVWLMLMGVAKADNITIDFSNGAPSPSVAVIFGTTSTSQVDFSGGRLNAHLPNTFDSVVISPTIFNPNCWIFRGVSLNIPESAGIGFGLMAGDAMNSDAISMAFFNTTPAGSFGVAANGLPIVITVKLIEQVTINGLPQPPRQIEIPTQTFTVTQDQLNRIERVRVDCVGPGRIRFEFVLTGLFNDFESGDILAPGVCSGQVVNGFIQNLSGQVDPPVMASVDALDLETTHVPEPATIILLGTGLVGVAMKMRAKFHRG